MSIVWDPRVCTGCPHTPEPPCARVCPCNLLYRGHDGKLACRDKTGCWDCAACVKACPNEALYLSLPPVIGGNGARLYGRAYRDHTAWRIQLSGGKVIEIKRPALNKIVQSTCGVESSSNSPKTE